MNRVEPTVALVPCILALAFPSQVVHDAERGEPETERQLVVYQFKTGSPTS